MLRQLLLDIAHGVFPPADGDIRVLPPEGSLHGVLAFTAHSIVVTDLSPRLVLERLPSGDLADLELVVRQDLEEHPRVQRARRLRRDVSVYSDAKGRGLVTIRRGLAGRLELSFEVDDAHQRQGLGRRLVAAALCVAPAGEPVFAQVASGNAQSLRSLLAVGFRPIGSEVLFEPACDS